MTDDLLNGNVDNTPQFDESKDYLAELVGEGKKFKTPQDLAKGKAQSDLYIEDMKRKQDELRSDYLKLREDATSRAKLEDLLNQLEAKQQLNNREQPNAKEVQDKPVIDPKAIEDLFDKRFSEMENSRKFKENNKVVGDKLKEAYGENYQSTLLKQLETLDLTPEEFNDLAKRKPNLLLKTLGLDGTKQTENFQSPLRTSQRSEQFAPQGAQKRTWAYYQKLKAENPKLYYDPKTNVQMFNDHQALGNAFEDGDFEQ